MRTILGYLPAKSSGAVPSVFVSAHPTVDKLPSGPDINGVVRLAKTNPNALKWPIVVDWMHGRAAVGNVEGVKGILEELRRERDGEK